MNNDYVLKKSEVERLWADNTKAKKLLKWEPKYKGLTGFRKGLEKTVDWFTDQYNLKNYKKLANTIFDQMIATILIVGAGQLGSRYLQGLVGYSEELNIYVQDISQQSLQVAKNGAGTGV